MDEVKKLIEELERLNGEADELESKASKEADETKKAGLQELLKDKLADYEAKKAELATAQAKAKRQKEVAEAKGSVEQPKVESKRGEIGDAPEIVPDNRSAHNQAVHQKKLDDAVLAYMLDDSRYGAATEAKWDGELRKALRYAHPDAVGYKAPSYMSRYILGYLGGKTVEDLERCVGVMGKGSNDVLTSDSSGTNSGGGSVVPHTFVPELFRYPQITVRLMDRCLVKRAVTGQAQFPRLTQSTNRYGVVAAWGNEGAAIAEDNPVFSRQDVSTGRLGLLTQLSLKELRTNRVGLEAELAWMFRGAMNEQINRAILQGNAANNRPQGINHNTAITAGVNTVARETASQVSYNDLVRLQFAVADAIFEDGVFVMQSGSNGALRYVAALDDSSGRPVLRNHNIGWREGVGAVRTIAGSEFIATPDNTANLGARGDVIYGDFRGYGLAIDLDVTIERSDHYAWNTGLATFRVTAYVGGYPIGPDNFSVLADVAGVSSSSSSSST